MKSIKQIIVFSIMLITSILTAQDTGFYGTVTNQDGQPLIDAYVYAEKWDEVNQYWYWSGGTYTNEFGSYTITGLSAGAYRLYASCPEYISTTTISMTLNVGEMKSVDFVLYLGGKITGRVTDEQGNPVAGARVYAWGPSYGATYTSETGTYTITGLEEGSYYVYCELPSQSELVGQYKSNISVSIGQVTTVNFVLPRAGQIFVKVVDELGNPVNDVWIYISPYYSVYEKTGTNGEFLISRLMPGRYDVSCEPYVNYLGEEVQKDVTISSGETEFILFVLKPRCVRSKIEGKITVSNNFPVENARVEIFSDDTRWGRIVNSNDEGKYVITDIPPGKYVLTVYPPEGQNLATVAEVLYVEEDKTLIKDISLTPAIVSGNISPWPLGTLSSGTTGYSVIALPNILLTKENLLKEYLISSLKRWKCNVKSNGSYELLLPQGSYNLYLVSYEPNYTFVTVHGMVPNISVSPGQQLTGKNISATIGTNSISGTISVSEGSLLPENISPLILSGKLNNCVVITDANHNLVGLSNIIVSTQTPQNGYYQIKNLPSGSYNIYVIPSMLSGYGSVSEQVSISAEQIKNFSLTTKPVGKITGIITNARDNTPVSSARVSVITLTGEKVSSAITSSDGRYTLTISTAGIYDIKISAYWFEDKIQPHVFVYPERETEQNLQLYFGISEEQEQKVQEFIEKLKVRIDTSTIANEIANLVVEIKLLDILPKIADWLTEAQIPVYLTGIGKVLDVCKDKIDFHKLVDIDTTTIVVEINKMIQKWNQEELTNIYYGLLDNTTFYFDGKPVHPWVIQQEGWYPNFVEFYVSSSPQNCTFGGLFPEGVPQKIVDILTPDFDLVLNSKVSQEQIKDYMINTVKPKCQTVLQSEPNNPEANFVLAVIEFYEFLEHHQETFSKMYIAISSGNVAGAYQIYKSTDIENQLHVIRTRLDKVKQAGHFWLTFVISHEVDANPFKIDPTETEVTPYPIPSEGVNILISFVDSIEAIMKSFVSLGKQFVEGPYIFDLDPNKLDFSNAKEPLQYISALRNSNPDFLRLKTIEKDGIDGAEIMSKLKRQLIINAEVYKNTLNGIKLIVKSITPGYGTYDRLAGIDKQIEYVNQVLDDLQYPAKYTIINEQKVNLSAWFDNPPANFLDTIEKYIKGEDLTFGGLIIMQGYGIVSGRVSVGQIPIKNVLVKAIQNGTEKSSDLTDEDGVYILTLSTGVYKLQISKPGYPIVEKDVTVVSEEITTVDFVLSAEQVTKYYVKGRVVDNKGIGISAVKIKLNNNETTTDDKGYYIFTDVVEGEYVITPEKTNWTFQPVSTTVYVSQNMENINFVGTYILSETPTTVDLPIGSGGTNVTVEMPKPKEGKIIVEERPDKPKELLGTVNPTKGEAVCLVFKPDLKPEEYVNKEYKIIVFNLVGEVVKEFTKIPQNPDDTWIKWIPEDLPSGTYIISVTGPGVKVLQKMAVLR